MNYPLKIIGCLCISSCSFLACSESPKAVPVPGYGKVIPPTTFEYSETDDFMLDTAATTPSLSSKNGKAQPETTFSITIQSPSSKNKPPTPCNTPTHAHNDSIAAPVLTAAQVADIEQLRQQADRSLAHHRALSSPDPSVSIASASTVAALATLAQQSGEPSVSQSAAHQLTQTHRRQEGVEFPEGSQAISNPITAQAALQGNPPHVGVVINKRASKYRSNLTQLDPEAISQNVGRGSEVLRAQSKGKRNCLFRLCCCCLSPKN